MFAVVNELGMPVCLIDNVEAAKQLAEEHGSFVIDLAHGAPCRSVKDAAGRELNIGDRVTWWGQWRGVRFGLVRRFHSSGRVTVTPFSTYSGRPQVCTPAVVCGCNLVRLDWRQD